ncbi:MAG: GIY-YIG nuclease family protein, partial [Flavobacteriales bacterium]
MSHHVYIIECLSSGVLYKGYSTDIQRRLQQHNDGKSRYTASRGPWKLVYCKECP